MRVSRAVLAVTVLAGSSAVAFAVSTGSASAAELEPQILPAAAARLLPVTSVSDVLVDPAHRHILISDHEAGRLVVTNYGGTVLARRDGLAGIRGLALSSDSSTIYAARTDARAIVAFDAATVTPKASYPLGDTVYPYDVAVAGGKVWFGYMGAWSPDGDFDGNFGSVDVAAAEPVVHLHDKAADGSAFDMAPLVVSSPAAPDRLVVSDISHHETTSATAASYDVSGGTERRISAGTVVNGYTNEAVLSADGSALLTAGFGIWSSGLGGLGTRTRLTADNSATSSLALLADGRLAAGLPNSMATEPDVAVYPAGSTTPDAGFKLSQVERYALPLVHRVLAEPEGRLFAVSRGDQYHFWQLSGPAFAAPTITVDAPATGVRGQALTVTGTIGGAIGLPDGTGLAVTRTDVESPYGKAVTTVKVESGRFGFDDVPLAGGPVKYTVSYAGSEAADAATGNDTVQLPRATPALALTGDKSVHTTGDTVTVTATLGTTYTNRTVEFWTQRAGDGVNTHPASTVKVTSAGKASLKLALSRNTTVTVRFAGDGRYAPRSAAALVYAKAKINTGLYNHYKTGRIGSQTYGYLRTSKDPKFVHIVTPYPNRTARTVVQYYSGGRWKTWRTVTTKLSSTGKATLTLTGTYRAGVKWRARAEYLYGTSGDKVNATAAGAWKYYTFTR
ncbi:YncE family protein [Actinoplanes xinjiangensis]|uniref:Ig-like domain-containing protein n=1 Tax=Actinoplanes xinjiangensis TaxID=512350 RepID=A0A316FDH0_9ACTN|nr:hypothetical protein [Actinoplanes xinjiangensis]PWK46459.1 hypothetical protein BC793_10924 [Actinoplanes xinjiangensis]GIF40721.1 hypothetical protein Axi01nite_50320 [Actinoplanes xinjiangensis]